MTRAWLVDTAERTGLTFVEALAGALILAGTGGITLTALHTAAAAGLAAALAVVKAAAAQLLTGSTSLVPPADDAAAVDAETAAEDARPTRTGDQLLAALNDPSITVPPPAVPTSVTTSAEAPATG